MSLNGLGLNLIRVFSSLLLLQFCVVSSLTLGSFSFSIMQIQLLKVFLFLMDNILILECNFISWRVMWFLERWCSTCSSKWSSKRSSISWGCWEQDMIQEVLMDQGSSRLTNTWTCTVGWHLRDTGDMLWWWMLCLSRWSLELECRCCSQLEHFQFLFITHNKFIWSTQVTKLALPSIINWIIQHWSTLNLVLFFFSHVDSGNSPISVYPATISHLLQMQRSHQWKSTHGRYTLPQMVSQSILVLQFLCIMGSFHMLSGC